MAYEVLTRLIGGSATKIRIVSRNVFHVNSTPRVLSHLRSELNAVMPAPNVPSELEALEQQSYPVNI